MIGLKWKTAAALLYTILPISTAALVVKDESNMSISEKEALDKLMIKPNVSLETQDVSAGIFEVKGKRYKIADAKSVSMFTDDATYIINKTKQKVPIATGSMLDDGENQIIFSKDTKGMVKSATVVNKLDGSADYYESISVGVLVQLDESNINDEELKKFYFETFPELPQRKRNLRRLMTNRNLQATCSQYKVIELALAYESSFCADYSNNSGLATAEINNIVAIVSARYEQIGLCTKVRLSYLEGYCNPASDPYTGMVALNQSGCGGRGLLQEFQSYWFDNRSNVPRDSAHLISGTGLECDNDGCIIGCAFVGVLCNTFAGYGVNWVTFTTSVNLRAVLLAHELGHNADASHYNVQNHIMFPSVNSATNGFSSTTINSFLNHFDEVTCIDTEVVSQSPTDAPIKSPTQSPTETPTKIPTKAPTDSPTESPTDNPTNNPTKAPTDSPTKNPTDNPTNNPTEVSTDSPTKSPTNNPTKIPTQVPTDSPTKNPTNNPTKAPTNNPTKGPTDSPTVSPTDNPTKVPTDSPTATPTNSPTKVPTDSPTLTPTKGPSTAPTHSPTQNPTESPTVNNDPTATPTKSPTKAPVHAGDPTSSPTPKPSKTPTQSPTTSPTESPTGLPTESPTGSPTENPTALPTENPTASPTKNPTASPTTSPTKIPTASPTTSPTKNPTAALTENPTVAPTTSPTKNPTAAPTTPPTKNTTAAPTTSPTKNTTAAPTKANDPTQSPTVSPAKSPTKEPTKGPTMAPTRPQSTPQPTAERMCCPNGYSGLRPYDSCKKFFRCVNGNVFSIVQNCGTGTLFDYTNQVCNWPSAVTCGIEPPCEKPLTQSPTTSPTNDSGTAPTKTPTSSFTCGDGICNFPFENISSCAIDCGGTVSNFRCGDGDCNAGDGEDCRSCPQDCNGKLQGQNKYCCGGNTSCSDRRCRQKRKTCTTRTMGTKDWTCGDMVCTGGAEDATTCQSDCTTTGCCGDGVCNADEDCKSCPQDCRGRKRNNGTYRYCCVGNTSCSDGRCRKGGFQCSGDAACTVQPSASTVVSDAGVEPSVEEELSPDEPCSVLEMALRLFPFVPAT